MKIPMDLQRVLGEGILEPVIVGESGARVYRVLWPLGVKGYLKVGREGLDRESAVYQWLRGRLPVPEVLYFGAWEEQYLFLSEVPGFSGIDPWVLDQPQVLVPLLAQGLRRVHAVELGDCPFDQSLPRLLEKARQRVAEGVGSEELLRSLEKSPPTEDLVFIHGDYCLPNVILSRQGVTGFIDLGDAGVGDRYQDLVWAQWSLGYNLGTPKWFGLFCEVYGIEIDQAKLSFYQALNTLL